MDFSEAKDRRRRRWAKALILGSPVFAVAIVLGVALTDIYMLPSVNLPDYGADWIVPFNAGLAFIGSAVGGACLRARAVVRMILSAAAGVFAVAMYFGLIVVADQLIPAF